MKIFLIGFYTEGESSDICSICKATTSYEAARQYVLDSIEKYRQKYNAVTDFNAIESEEKYAWTITYKSHDIEHTVEREHEYVLRIEPIELSIDEAIPEARRPMLEARCEALEKQNDSLKAEVAELKKNNSAAQCWLTFWDGGKYEDFDHLLKQIHTAREVLNGGEKGNSHILKLFQDWEKKQKSV